MCATSSICKYINENGDSVEMEVRFPLETSVEELTHMLILNNDLPVHKEKGESGEIFFIAATLRLFSF